MQSLGIELRECEEIVHRAKKHFQSFGDYSIPTLVGQEKRQKDKKHKYKRQKREFNNVMSGQFCTLAMF